MPKPSLTCVNNSEQHGSFAIFRDGPPNQDQEPSVLVWMAYPVAPGSEVTLTWLEDYSFVWSESGTVTPDASFVARQVLPADLNERNHVQLTVDSLGAPMFQALGSGGQPGALTVEILQNVVPDRIQVGFGLSGLAVHLLGGVRQFSDRGTGRDRGVQRGGGRSGRGGAESDGHVDAGRDRGDYLRPAAVKSAR